MVDPEFPASLAELPEPELPGPRGPGSPSRREASAGATSTCSRTTRDRRPPWPPSAPSPSSSGTRPRAASSRPGPRAPLPDGDPRRRRPVHPVPAPGYRPAVRQLRPRLDVLVPQPRQPDCELGTLARVHHGPRRRMGRHRAGARVHAPPAPRCHRGEGRQPVRAGLHRLPRTDAGRARRRRPRARRRRGHHRSGGPGRAARAVPALPRHRARPPPAPGCGGHGMRRGPRRAGRPRQRALGAAGFAERVTRDRAQAPPDADGRLPLRGRGGRVTPVGHRGAARRRPPGHASSCSARRGSARSTSPRSGTRRPPWSAPSTTPSTRRRRRGWRAGRTGTRSTVPSTSSPPASCPTRSW